MDFTQMTSDQVTSLSDEELADLRDRAAYNAIIIENRNVISDGAHRIARHLRSLHYAAEREIENRQTSKQIHRQKQPDDMHDGAPSLEGLVAQPHTAIDFARALLTNEPPGLASDTADRDSGSTPS